MRRVLAGLTLCVTLSGIAAAQTALGTYTMTPPGGKPLTFVLQKDAAGKITGSLSGNGASFQVVEAKVDGSDIVGTLSGNGLKSYFEAGREGANLHVIMADIGPDGKPDYIRAREFTMAPSSGDGSGSGSGSAPAAQAGAPATSKASDEGNPFAASAAPDKFAGTFASTEITLTLSKRGAEYAGTIKYRGAEYPATAKGSGESLAGSFNAGGRAYDMTIASAGDGKYVNLTTAGTTYMLARGADAGNPLAAGAAPSPAAGGAASALAKTAQDQQIVNLLLSTAWCSFSYSGGSTYTGGSAGTTRTTRAVFSQDGTVRETSNAETTTSGAPGNTYGSNSGGQSGRWRIENTMLMLSADGMQWAPSVMKIADNGSGAPIVTVGGKEYMRCR